MHITRQSLKEQIRQIVNDYPNSWSQIIRSSRNSTSLESLIENAIPKVKGDEYTVATKVYWLLNDLEDFPKCMNSNCSNTFEHRNVVNLKKGYRKHCCQQCAKDSDERKKLYVETCRKNYGVDNISQYEGTKKKKEEKALAKYGVKNVAQADEVKKTIAETNERLYSASTYLHSVQGEEHKRKTCFEKYGVDSFSKTSMHTEMMKVANQKNYGVDWPQQNRDFMKDMLKKYTYDGMNFDSAVELAVYIYCKDNNIKFEYQPNVVFYYECDGKKHAYEPDFLVEGKLVEVKGDHFFKEDGAMQNPFDHAQDALYEAKHQCMLKNNVEIWRHEQYDVYMKYVEEKYGKDYLKQFKNK